MITTQQLKNNIQKLPVQIKLYSEKIQKVVDGKKIPFVYSGILIGYTDYDLGTCTIYLLQQPHNQVVQMCSSQFKAFHILEKKPTVNVPAHIKDRFIHLYSQKDKPEPQLDGKAGGQRNDIQ